MSARDAAFDEIVLATLPVGVILYRAEGPCETANPAAAEFLDIPVEKLLEQNFREITSWRESGLLALAEELLETGVTASHDMPFVSTTGRSLHLDLRMAKLELPDGPRLLLAFSDISERMRMEKALREGEDRYRALIENTPTLFFSVDRDGVFTAANKNIVRLTGRLPQETVGRGLDEAGLPPEVASQWHVLLDEVLSRGRPVATETTTILGDDRLHIMEISLVPILDDAGEVVGARGRVSDVTGHREAQQALRESEERFRTLIEKAPVAIALSRDGAIIYANPPYLRMFGFDSLAEILGRPIADQIALQERRRVQEIADLLGEGSGVPKTHETVGLRRDGSEFPFEASSSNVELADGFALLGFFTDLTERRKMEASLRLTQYSVDHANDAIFWTTPDGTLVEATESTASRLGYSREEMLGMTIFDISTEMTHDRWPALWKRLQEKGSLTFESGHRTREGVEYPVEVTVNLVEFEGKEYNCAFARDISDRKEAEMALHAAEMQLQQAQKIDAIGQLAGGIAHDFNNLLTAIIGYADLSLAAGEEAVSEVVRSDIQEIRAAAERAGALTRQILAFSRRQALQPEVLSLNDVLVNLKRLLGRTLGENIDLVTVLDPNLGSVEVDAHQFEQVVINLALNARDAMPEGGRLALETANVELDEAYVLAHPMMQAGHHVMLAVSDTGIGMDADTLSHVFEPFFTTKEPGEGTGLGLSTAYGIVKQSGGDIFVYSEPGQGSTFKVFLPRVERESNSEQVASKAKAAPSGGETVLVVEDEEAVLALVARVLGRLGYRVLTAGDAGEALALLGDPGLSIDLLLTDVVLANGLQGDELVEQTRAVRPELKVLYMSGYTRDAIVHGGRLDPGVNYLEKPFTPAILGSRVREILDTGVSPGANSR